MASAGGATAMLSDRDVEAVYQGLLVEGFRQKAERAVVKCLFAISFRGNGRDEQKRHAAPLTAQIGLQLQTAHGGHSNICDDAPGVVEFGGLKKSLCRFERANDVSQRSDEIVQAGANRCIIIDD